MKTLALKKDTLVELTIAELALVDGAAPAPWTPGCHITIELTERLSELAC